MISFRRLPCIFSIQLIVITNVSSLEFDKSSVNHVAMGNFREFPNQATIDANVSETSFRGVNNLGYKLPSEGVNKEGERNRVNVKYERTFYPLHTNNNDSKLSKTLFNLKGFLITNSTCNFMRITSNSTNNKFYRNPINKLISELSIYTRSKFNNSLENKNSTPYTSNNADNNAARSNDVTCEPARKNHSKSNKHGRISRHIEKTANYMGLGKESYKQQHEETKKYDSNKKLTNMKQNYDNIVFRRLLSASHHDSSLYRRSTYSYKNKEPGKPNVTPSAQTSAEAAIAPGRVYRHGPPARLTRDNIIVRESDIAAIFRGVAYGMPTESILIHKPLVQSQQTAHPLVSSTATSFITADDNVGLGSGSGSNIAKSGSSHFRLEAITPTKDKNYSVDWTGELFQSGVSFYDEVKLVTLIPPELHQKANNYNQQSTGTHYPLKALATLVHSSVTSEFTFLNNNIQPTDQPTINSTPTDKTHAETSNYFTDNKKKYRDINSKETAHMEKNETKIFTNGYKIEIQVQQTKNGLEKQADHVQLFPISTRTTTGTSIETNNYEVLSNNASDPYNATYFNIVEFFNIIHSWDSIKQFVCDNVNDIWKIHIYCVSTFFGMISCISFCRLICRCHALPFFLHVSFYLVVFGSSLVRALIVLWDPYKGQRILPELFLSALYIAGEPSVGVVMSSFIVLMLNVFYGMIALPVIIAFCSALEMATGLFVELASKHFTFYIGNFSQEYLDTLSFIVGMVWNSIVCLGYIVILSSGRLRKRTTGRRADAKHVDMRKSDSDANRDRSNTLAGTCYQISCYCFVATFAQLFMIALYVYTLLHPNELLSRPNELKEKWVLFQILGRMLEAIVYSFLLISASKIVFRKSVISIHSIKCRSDSENNTTSCLCQNVCCCGRENYFPSNNRKYSNEIYTVNKEGERINHCSTDDFQLVWTRNSREKYNSESDNFFEKENKNNTSCKNTSGKLKTVKVGKGKTKKRKTLRERNEKLQVVTSQEHVPSNENGNKCGDGNSTRDAAKDRRSQVVEICMDTNSGNINSKYHSIRGKCDLKSILEVNLPKVDTSLYKYMGVTLPHSTQYTQKELISSRAKRAPASDQDVLEEIEHLTKQTPKLPTQFWSPQHKPSKASFKNLPPLPLRAQTPINLPSLPPLNLRPVAPLNLPPIKLCQFPARDFSVPQNGRREEWKRKSGQYEDGSKDSDNDCDHLRNAQEETIFEENGDVTPDFMYAENKDFIRDFMTSHPSPFSERLSSADLATVSSFSEMRVDYLTDLSSADGNSIGSLTYSRASRMSVNNISDNANFY